MGMRNVILILAVCLASCDRVVVPDPVDGGAGGSVAAVDDPPEGCGEVDALKCEPR